MFLVRALITGEEIMSDIRNSKKNIICFGDSLVFGYDEQHEYKWTTLLDEIPGIDAANRGVCSQTTGDMLKRFDRQVIRRSPDMMILIGGYNDIFQGYSVETALTNLEHMVRTALENGISVIMCVPTPIVHPFDPPYWVYEVDLARVIPLTKILCEEIRSLYIDIKKDLQAYPGTALALADLEKTFLDHGSLAELYLDEFHQNAKGHRVIYEEMVRIIRS